MAKYNNYDRADGKKSLKRADAKKNSENGLQQLGADIFASRSRRASTPRNKSATIKRKLPLVVDIIIALLMIAILAAIVVGAYAVFRYFTVDYENASVSYTVMIKTDELKHFKNIKSELEDDSKFKAVYYESNGSVEYFGRITSVEIFEDEETVLVTVTAGAKYRAAEGYYIKDTRIAVGVSCDMRISAEVFNATVVELEKKSTTQNSFFDTFGKLAESAVKGGR